MSSSNDRKVRKGNDISESIGYESFWTSLQLYRKLSFFNITSELFIPISFKILAVISVSSNYTATITNTLKWLYTYTITILASFFSLANGLNLWSLLSHSNKYSHYPFFLLCFETTIGSNITLKTFVLKYRPPKQVMLKIDELAIP